MKIKLFALIFAVIAICSMCVSAQDRPYVEVTSCPLEDTALIAHQNYDLALKVENNGNLDAYNTVLSLEGFSEYHISALIDTSAISVQTSDSMVKTNEAVWVRIPVKNVIENGRIYPITGKFTYQDKDGNEYSTAFELSLSTFSKYNFSRYNEKYDEESKSPSLFLKEYSVSKRTLRAGDSFSIDFTMKNNSTDMSAFDLMISYDGNCADILSRNASSVTTLDRIGPLGLSTHTMEFAISEQAKTQMANLSVTVSFRDARGDNFTERFTFTVKIDGAESTEEIKKEPRIVIENVKCSSLSVNPGEFFTVSAEIANYGDGDALNVGTLISGLSGSSVFTPSFNAEKSVQKLAPGEKMTVEFELCASDSIGDAVHSLGLDVSYENTDGLKQSKSSSFYVASQGRVKDAPRYILSDFSLSSDIIKPEDVFALSYVLENAGIGAHPEKATVSISSEACIPADGRSTKTIAPDSNGKIYDNINLKVKNDIPSGIYPVNITVEGYTKDSDEFSSSLKAYITVINEKEEEEDEDGDEKTKLIPRVILESFSSNPDSIVAGKDFLFSFAFKNTSKELDVYNLKISVSSPDAVFSPVEGSNVFFAEELALQDTKSFSIMLNAKSTAEAKSYPVNLHIEYQDIDGNMYTADENVSFYVSQPYRLEFSNFYCPSEVYGTYPINLSIQYFNKGKSALANLAVSIEGDFTMSDSSEMYIGNFPSSSYDYLDLVIFPNSVGALSGKVVFKFEDSAAVEQRVEYPFTVNVMEEIYVDTGDFGYENEFMPPEVLYEEKTPLWIYCAAGAGALLVIIIVVSLIIRAKRRKREELEDL